MFSRLRSSHFSRPLCCIRMTVCPSLSGPVGEDLTCGRRRAIHSGAVPLSLGPRVHIFLDGHGTVTGWSKKTISANGFPIFPSCSGTIIKWRTDVGCAAGQGAASITSCGTAHNRSYPGGTPDSAEAILYCLFDGFCRGLFWRSPFHIEPRVRTQEFDAIVAQVRPFAQLTRGR